MITSVPRILEKGQAKLSFVSQACLIGRQCRVRLVRWKTFTTTESGSLIAACAREMKTTLLGIWFMTITTMLIMMNDTCTLAWTFMHTYHLPRAIAWLLLLLFNWQLLYSIHTHLQKNTKGCFLVWRTNRRNAYRNFFWRYCSICDTRLPKIHNVLMQHEDRRKHSPWSHLDYFQGESWFKNTRYCFHCGTAPYDKACDAKKIIHPQLSSFTHHQAC